MSLVLCQNLMTSYKEQFETGLLVDVVTQVLNLTQVMIFTTLVDPRNEFDFS